MSIEQVINLLKEFNPLSIFLYGSQAINSQNSQSDYEIGVVFEDENYVNRAEIRKKVPDNSFAIFPFKYGQLKTYSIDTPFQKNIYIASLINGSAKTVYGEKVIESLPAPNITIFDLLMDTSFNLGYALSAVRVMKIGQIELANEFFYKSLFYATRNLIYFQKGILISGYNNIFNHATQLDIPQEYQELLAVARDIRNEKTQLDDTSLLFKNISYINQYVIPKIQQGLS